MERRASSPVRRELSGLLLPSKRRNHEATTGHQGCQCEREFVGIASRENHNAQSKKYATDEDSDQVGGISNRSSSRGPFRHDVSNARPIGRQDVVLVLPKLPFPFLTGFFSSVQSQKVFLRPAT
jgi:hypothetical protein